MPKVVIDGIEYVPVLDSGPTIKQIATALIERYMGKFDDKDFDELANTLQVYVTEDVNQPTVAETMAEIVRAVKSISEKKLEEKREKKRKAYESFYEWCKEKGQFP
jgi:ribosomal protein S17E